MIGRLNISRLSHKLVTLPLLLTMSSSLVTTSNGSILKSSLMESLTCSVELKKLYWSVTWNPHLWKRWRREAIQFFISFYRKYQLSVVSILSLFLACNQFLSLFLYFFNVCNSYNRHFTWKLILAALREKVLVLQVVQINSCKTEKLRLRRKIANGLKYNCLA